MTLFSMELGGVEVGRAWKLHSYPDLPLQDAGRKKLSVQFSGPPRERAQRRSLHAFPAKKSVSIETRLPFFGPISCTVNGKYAGKTVHIGIYPVEKDMKGREIDWNASDLIDFLAF